jgi:hypothetical protein
MTRSEAGRLGWEKAQAGLKRHTLRQKEVAQAKSFGVACLHCKELLSYDKRRNRFCSKSCAASHNNRGVRRHGSAGTQRQCRCGKDFVTKDGRGQTWCSQSCAARSRSDDLLASWIKGDNPGGNWWGVAAFVRRWLVETFGEKCTKCSWAEVNPKSGKVPLHVDHIDGNPDNHRPGNLRFLCPNCHSLTPTFGALNKGCGRKKRYVTR